MTPLANTQRYEVIRKCTARALEARSAIKQAMASFRQLPEPGDPLQKEAHQKISRSLKRAQAEVFEIPWREYFSLGAPLNPFQTYFSPDEMLVLTYQKIARDDSDLVDVVEKMGARANGPMSTLEVIEIPGDVVWQIEECEGLEHVAEAHRTWFGKAYQA